MPEKASNVIRLGGEDIRLIHPKGLDGVRFVAHVQGAFKSLLPAVAIAEQAGVAEVLNDQQAVAAIIDAVNSLFLDESSTFISVIMPGFYQYSTMGLSLEEAADKLAEIQDPPLNIFFQFVTAANFWMTLDEQEEALEEALKKSKVEPGTEVQ